MSENEKIGYFAGLPEREKTRITLPSGRSITILETTGREEKILSRLQDRSKLSETIDAYLSGVTEDLDGEPGKVPASKFDDMLVGDRIFILIQARLLTHGAQVRHKSTCTQCHAQNEHEVDLQAIVDSMKPYPHKDQREFSVELGKGTLYFELPNGKTEGRIAKEKDTDINSKLRFMRLWEKTPKGNIPVSLDSLKSKYISALRQAVRENECMIDTMTELPCDKCGKIASLDIIGMADFLFPSLT